LIVFLIPAKTIGLQVRKQLKCSTVVLRGIWSDDFGSLNLTETKTFIRKLLTIRGVQYV